LRSQQRAGRARILAAVNMGAALILLMTSRSYGQSGLNLSWDDCGAFGLGSRSFACDTNTGSHTLVASFAAPDSFCVIGTNGVIDLQTSSATVPDWWEFVNSGACRVSALSGSADFRQGFPSCVDFWQGAAASGVAAYQVGSGAPNRARIMLAATISFECITVPAHSEMYAFRLTVSNQATVGPGACAGCREGACIVFNSLALTQYSGFPIVELTSPLTRNYVTWQGGHPDCPGATLTRNATWGAVKSLYR
jgi:hypothetical protein